MLSRTVDRIRPGDSARLVRKLTLRDLELIAALAGGQVAVATDSGPTAWAGLMLGALVGGELPGLGSRIARAELQFHAAPQVDETLDLTLTVETVRAATRTVGLRCRATGPLDAPVFEGRLEVIAPAEAMQPGPATRPGLIIEERGAKFHRLIAQAARLPPLRIAVVHPVEPNALSGAVAAARAGLISPVFVGPEARIRAAAQAAGLDLSPWPLLATEHSDAAAEEGARMAHDGKVHALMKGSLHTDEFLRPVLRPEMNLRTGRRISHVFLMDVPGTDRPLFITDGAINIAPDLEAKRDIVQNAIGMAHALGIAAPRVAILSAVETVNPRIPSTLDAAALCKMAERGQITGGVLDGPLAFDNAVSTLAAEIKHIRSEVAGRADILLAPDLDAGNMMAKQLKYLANSEAAGVVLGARVPIVLTSRADSAQSRLASCAVAALIHAHVTTGGVATAKENPA
ncbi:bifunctional enoyl-CoA hydratase/phosphate acetyltransferase [Defluviimonas sp. 20V17]|nr:bifunctional enoyl-CoA hydratase/phosphate acetyltransferase [Defluviimonas sp. 20V17]